MNKNKAIVKFCIICTLIVAGVFACFANFRVPFTSDRFIGFWGAINEKMGIDLKGGVLAVFDTEEDATSTEINATVNRLERMLVSKGYVEATVVRQGSQIRVEVPQLKNPEEIFEAVGTPEEIEMRTASGEVFLTGEHIKKVSYYQDQNYQHGVKLTFTTEGGKKFREAVTNAGEGGTIGIYYKNGTEISSPTISDTSAGSDNTTVITGGWETRAEAEKFKLQIESGLFETKLTISETSVISATLGDGALTGGIIACIIGLLFIFIFMYCVYGDLGLLSNLSMLVFVILFLFALAVVGSVQLTLPGIAGIILSIAMAVDANIIIFERIKEEFKSGKRMAIAVESGFNKSALTIADANITTIIASGVLYWLGTGAIKGFAITLCLGVIISMVCSLLITRSFAKLYLYINGNNAARLKLKKDETSGSGSAMTVAPKQKIRTLNK